MVLFWLLTEKEFSMFNRRGKFSVSKEMIDIIVNKKYRNILMDFIIVKAEFDFIEGKFNYSAYSMLFDELEEGDEIPEYMIISDKEKIRAERIV